MFLSYEQRINTDKNIAANDTRRFLMHALKASGARRTNKTTFSHEDVIMWEYFPRYCCGEFTGDRWILLTKASDAEFWSFLWSAPGQTVEKKSWRQWFEAPSRSLWRYCNDVELKFARYQPGDVYGTQIWPSLCKRVSSAGTVVTTNDTSDSLHKGQ